MSDFEDSDFEPDSPLVLKVPRPLVKEVQQHVIKNEDITSDSELVERVVIQYNQLFQDVPNTAVTSKGQINVICEGKSRVHGKIVKEPSLEGYLRSIILCNRNFSINYLNIIDEFADVEIFLISLDSLIVECLNHEYHNRNLGSGQSLVLCRQVDRLLDKLTSVGGKFKLVVFTDLNEIFTNDSHLDLARTIVIEHITQGNYGKDLIYFMSPYDGDWDKFLREMTPSFIIISMESPTFSPSVWNCLTSILPIVLFNSLSINFKTVMAYRLNDHYYHLEEDIQKQIDDLWNNEKTALTIVKFPPINVATLCDLWANIIYDLWANITDKKWDFDTLASAILLSTLIASKIGNKRAYPPATSVSQPSLTLSDDCEKITRQAKMTLQLMDCKSLMFSLIDFWDGRMILSIFEYIKEGKVLLPTSLKAEFENYRVSAGIELVLSSDTNEKLLKKKGKTVHDVLLNKVKMYSVKSNILESYAPEMGNYFKQFEEPTHSGYEQWLQEYSAWNFSDIPENFKPEFVIKTDWERFKENQTRQKQMRWYEMFATSLEGRGHLQVDFTRTSTFASMNPEDQAQQQKGWAGQKGNAGKKGKTTNKAKEIRDANVKAKEQKIIQDEKLKINHALQQGIQTVMFLERLMDTLQTVESKAFCAVELAKNEAARLIKEYKCTGMEKLEQKKTDCVELVGYIKDCFVKQWTFLSDEQKNEVVDLWVTLGFPAPISEYEVKKDEARKLDLKMDLVYYLMEYGGQLVDIQSDPMKDNRVTGFAPDNWQRKMLDTVDKGNSALIVAPTSAGKTFVSYYCMEKILRTSDHEVVVFVSPEKALMNQERNERIHGIVCGSVYARFKTKVMSKGKSQFVTLHPDYNMNALNCQILVTVAQCLEHLLLSTDPDVQEFVSRIRYVIFDEVHSIGVSEDSHMWEHLFLLIRCPFLALSATVSNIPQLYKWLANLETEKTRGKRKVDLIQYNERYSELELSIINIDDPTYGNTSEHNESLKPSTSQSPAIDLIQPFMPYGVLTPDKLKIFGIPDDQELPAKQILHLYRVLAVLDDSIRQTCEPNTFFGYTGKEPIWICRSRLRKLENKLKETFMKWVQTDDERLQQALKALRTGTISQQLDYRSGAFSTDEVADEYISRLVDELQQKNMLPAICFNDDGDMCELLAEEVVAVLEEREKAYMETAEFKNLDNSITRNDTVQAKKSAKRQRDADDKRKKGKKTEEDDDKDRKETVDPLGKQKAAREKALEKFKLKALKNGDQDLYQKAIERLKFGKDRESTKLLLKLIDRGVAFHHARLTSNEKQAVEILFRAGYLAVLFSTKTLALGQMSGRAGRRGFDHKGNVIFMGIPTQKMRRLLTASLPKLEGNPPFDTTFILRLLSYVNQKNGKGIQTTTEERSQVAISMLNNYFSLYTRKEANDGTLQKQLKHYFAFSVQFLRHLQLIDGNCFPQNVSSLCCLLHKFAPGNLLFAHLLQKGVFHKMCARHKGNPLGLKCKILIVLALLFTKIRMPPTYVPGQRNEKGGERINGFIELPDFPPDVQKHVDEYNKTAASLYATIMGGIDLKDPVFDITGNSSSLFTTEHLVSPISENYSHDDSFLPILSVQNRDYRGKKQVLRLLSTGLRSLATPNDPFYLVIQNLYEKYKSIFEEAFDMKKKR